MHHTEFVRQDELHRLAAQAITNQRRLAICYRMRRDLLSHAAKAGMDRFLKTSDADFFARHTLDSGQELLMRIEDEVVLSGGIPQIERDDRGEAHMCGGSEASQRIHVLANRLRDSLEAAWKVHDRLLAEASVAAQRDRLKGDRERDKADAA